jgi:hypothetical protein
MYPDFILTSPLTGCLEERINAEYAQSINQGVLAC